MSTLKHSPKRRDSFSGFRHDNVRTGKRRRLLVILALVTLLLIFLRTPAEHYLSSVLHFLFRPVFVAQHALGDQIGSYAYLFQEKRDLVDENTRLKDALDAVIIEGYSRIALREENDQLKKMFFRNPKHSFLLARVLASPGEVPYDTLLIDVGEDVGLMIGTRIFTDGDIVIGEVSQVFAESAIVTLYSSSGNEFSVRIGASSTPAVAHGVGGGNFKITLPKAILIREGDVVEIPELSPAYIGIIGAVEQSEQSSLQLIYVRFPFNISELEYVYSEVSRGDSEVASEP